MIADTAVTDGRLLAASSGWYMPANGAHHGFAVDRLMAFNLIAFGLCLLLAHGVLIAAFVKRKRSPQPGIWIVELVPLSLLCLLYAGLAIVAQRLWAENRFQGTSPTALQVEVVGVQFQWYFRYPGVDQTFGSTRPQLVNPARGNPLGIEPDDQAGKDDIVASELVLPEGREVDLRLRAHDVIHGFFVPGMRLKQNAVPGMMVHVHFTPIAIGNYEILCSQVCGLGHGTMHARLRVVSQDEYDSWLAAREQRRLAADHEAQ
jgi:cytochrome c oxidase subunit 2